MDPVKTCSRCGAILPLSALGCNKCGQPFIADVRGDVILPAQKSPTRAFLLSFGILAGFGQFYVGQMWKGLVWMLVAILVGIPTFGFGTLIANLASGIDAFRVARRLSRGQPAGTWDWFPD